MDQADRERPSAPDHADHGVSWLFWIPLCVTIYLLALGPAVKLSLAVPRTRPALETIYFWVEPLMRSSPACDAAIRWYISTVWQVK